MARTDPAQVVAALRKNRLRNEVRKTGVPPAMLDWQQEMFGRSMGAALPRDPAQFLQGTFTPLTPIVPVGINVPEGEDDRPGPRIREMPPGWNMPVGVPGSEGFKLASFATLRTYADIYSVARACVQTRKNEIRGLEWDIMPTPEAEKRMRGDRAAHKEFAERKAVAVAFFRRPDPDYLAFGSYIDAAMEEMLVTDALSLYLHPTQKKGGYGPFGKDVAALELISGSTIRPLVNNRGGRVRPPSPGYQQYLYGVPRVDLMEILAGNDKDVVQELGKPERTYRGDQLLYVPYTQRSWTPYGFPPLERTLIPTITGLRKQQYQMDFFDEGTIPGNYISPGENLGWTPSQLNTWQDQQNALAGDPAYKHKSVALPPGSKVFPMRPVPLADQFDEIVMSQVCMGYDVMPMEMGISPKVSTTQSPGAANQMAKATEKTNERKSLKPTLAFFTDVFNLLIQVVWAQEDMRFVFEGLEEDEDENALVERLVQLIQYGLASVDECRIVLNKPPWGLPITSDPVYVSPTAGMVPLGSIDPTTGKPMGTPPPAAIGAPPAAGGPLGAGPPGVGAPKPVAAIPGKPAPGAPGKAPDGTAAGTSPSGSKPGISAAPALGPDGEPDPKNPRDSIAPDDKVGQARQDAQEAHAQVQAGLHQDFASGKPLEPPVRPPISDATEDPEHGVKRPSPSTKAMLAELDMLCRHTCKGRDPGTWERRHLPEDVLDYYCALAKSFNPNDAAAITNSFIVACFGPPTLQAELEEVRAGVKTFSTAIPLAGQQSMAPYDLAGATPCTCCDSKPCTCSAGAGCCTCNDNGATVDQNPGGLRQDQASEVVKSGPKVPAHGRATRAWAGWRYDLQLADLYAGRLSEALGAAASPEGIAAAWLASQSLPGSPATGKGALSSLGQAAWSWLQSRGFAKPIRDAIQQVLTNLWTEGFAVGREAGREQLDSAYGSDFWSTWKPGDPDAARLTAGPGLQKLLDDYGIQTIKSVAATRLTQLAAVLADGFSKGDSSDTIAAAIEPVLQAPARARMIAITELARATTQAAVGEYRAAGMLGKSWSVTGTPPDDRVCPRCKANSEAGILPMDHVFPAGDEFPPGHPECRCAILPEELPDDPFMAPGVLKGLSPQQLELIAEDLDKGLGIAEILKYTAPHLVKSDSFVAGGLAIRAEDTGRVLMIQRAHNEDDPAGGFWEFPGGRLDPGESVEGAARREWAEETGLAVPAGRVAGTWDQGGYRGHVLSVSSESAVPILDRDKGRNPDDPGNKEPEAIAWWDPSELKDNPAVRPELQAHPKRVRRALEAAGDKVNKGVLADLATALDSHWIDGHNELSDRVSGLLKLPTGKIVYNQLLKNYPPDSIEWVRRATWKGPYLVPWDKVDHDDMDKWAASHQPERVDQFARKIEAGDDPAPVVLVADPDGNFIDVDGHHRALAYHKLDRPVRAWIGVIDPADRHAMEETHLDQEHEGSDPLNKAAGGIWVYKDAIDGHHVAGTPFTYHHGYIKIDPGDCHDGCGSAPAGGKYLPGHDAKHVKALHEAIQSGHLSHSHAIESLAHSPKLQAKLNAKMGQTPEGVPVAPKPKTPKAVTHPAPGEPEAPAAAEPTVTSGATPDGRSWTATLTPGGTGSTYHITAKGDPPAYPADFEMRFTYAGNGEVNLERKNAAGEWKPDPLNPTTITALQSRKAVYQAAAEHMTTARKAEQSAKPKPAPAPVPAAPGVAGGHVLGLWDSKGKSHAWAKDILDNGLVPEHGFGTKGAGAFKAHVAHEIARTIDASTASLVNSLYPPGWGSGGSYEIKLKDAAKDPSQYRYKTNGYGGGLVIQKKGTPEAAYMTGDLTDQMLKEHAVSQLIGTWAGTSNNTNVRSLALQRSAEQEFSLDDNVAGWPVTDELASNISDTLAQHGAAYRAFLRAQYNLTQKDLKDNGITELNVMRGMKWQSDVPDWAHGLKTRDKIPTPPLRPMSSWTVNSDTATVFAGTGGLHKVTLKATIPASSILSWPRTGFGCLSEYEIVAFPGSGQVTVGSAKLPA